MINTCAAAPLLLPTASQVPFHWFVPLMTAEVATHVYGSHVFGQQLPHYWIAMCYVPAALLSLAVCAAHNVLARKQFLSGLGVEAASGAGRHVTSKCATRSSQQGEAS
jgi:heme exporter protein D